MVKAESTTTEYIKLGLIVWMVFLVSLLLTFANGFAEPMEWMRWFMGLFLTVFAVFKLIGYSHFPKMFVQYDLIAQKLPGYARAYPFIELALGFLYLANIGGRFRDGLTFVIMAVGAVGVARAIRARRGVHCACLGNVIKLPLSSVTLAEDVGMAAMAAWMLLA